MKRIKTGLSILALIILYSLVFFPFRTPVNMDLQYGGIKFFSPFGYDEFGRNMFLFLAKGVGVSLIIAALTTICSVFLAVFLSSLISKSPVFFSLSDSLKVLPAIILALFLSSLGGPSAWKVILSLVLTRSPNIARSLYQRKILIEATPFYRISRHSGLGKLKAYLIHTLPHMLPLILEEAVITASAAIITESSLSFLGCGVKAGTPSIGGILTGFKDVVFVHPILIVPPALILFLLCLSLTLVAEGILELNPSLEASY